MFFKCNSKSQTKSEVWRIMLRKNEKDKNWKNAMLCLSLCVFELQEHHQ